MQNYERKSRFEYGQQVLKSAPKTFFGCGELKIKKKIRKMLMIKVNFKLLRFHSTFSLRNISGFSVERRIYFKITSRCRREWAICVPPLFYQSNRP